MKTTKTTVLTNTKQRSNALSLEENTNNSYRSVTLQDLVPEEALNRKGTYRITVEFENDE